MVFGPPNWSRKSLKFVSKTRSENNSIWKRLFMDFGALLASKILRKTSQFEESGFYEKPCFCLVKPMFFSFGALRKSLICSPKRGRETEHSETRNFMDFRTILASEIHPKSDAERSLFCDAMEIVGKSSQVNGARPS